MFGRKPVRTPADEADRARIAVLGTLAFALLEALDVDTVARINGILEAHKASAPKTGDPVYDACVEAEFERFITATELILEGNFHD